MITLSGTQLRLALKEIEEAEKNGFMYCEAVFRPKNINGLMITCEYSDLWEKAHPTDGNLNWGRFQAVSKRCKFKNGRLIRIKK